MHHILTVNNLLFTVKCRCFKQCLKSVTENCGFPKLKRNSLSTVPCANIEKYEKERKVRTGRDSGISFAQLNLLNSCLHKRDISSLKFMLISREIDGGKVLHRK